ncbi:hypothetical protein PAPYR_8261 [Paratrimastix pyriformis]|uniref:Uncharacterized protein n=1 Tax=Paratrimastix pyriformis TaxID=342808 RepID=A0ABQ8UB40_9EUKA|nr:hypothetical protein PAPYR_8261 [Paratrimastix pyriformis]
MGCREAERAAPERDGAAAQLGILGQRLSTDLGAYLSQVTSAISDLLKTRADLQAQLAQTQHELAQKTQELTQTKTELTHTQAAFDQGGDDPEGR